MNRQAVVRAFTLALVVLAMACTRKVAVESEPNRMQSSAETLELTGVYDYRVDVGGGQIVTGTMNLTRSGDGLDATMTSSMGAIDVHSVRRSGPAALIVETESPGGPATMEIEWQGSDRFRGIAFVGGAAYDIEGTRRP